MAVRHVCSEVLNINRKETQVCEMAVSLLKISRQD